MSAHPRRRRWVAATALAALLLTGVSTTAAAQPAADPSGTDSGPRLAGSAAAADAGGAHTVTLITGDVLDVAPLGNGQYATEPHARQGVSIDTFSTPEGDLYALPSDAEQLVAEGRLDLELFNVARLVEAGYTDELPVIVQYRDRPGARSAGARPAEALSSAAARLPGAADVRALESINAAAASLTAADLPDFWRQLPAAAGRAARPAAAPAATTLPPEVAAIRLDQPVRAHLDRSVPQIGAPAAWAQGLDGAGVQVAVLDTGVDATHPDLAGRIDAAESFVPGLSPDDRAGHGTHVASTVLGTGAASDGRFTGVAPGARLLAGKVLDDNGDGQQSWLIDGMEWAVAQGAPVVNMSLGTSTPSGGLDPLSQALNALTAEHGTLFVVSAGNNGSMGARSVGSPGAATAALTVGAVDASDELADFSSTGPLLSTNALKPDITAPGNPVIAAQAAGSGFGNPAPAGYASAQGTSMAAPHVAGAAAILAQQHPDWSHDELKAALTGSAAPHPGLTAYQQGAGRLDVAAAVEQQLLVTPAVLDFGSLPDPWDESVTKTLTLTNHGEAATTVDLAATVREPQGDPVPEAVTFEPASLTVPAGESATVDATYQPTAGTKGGYTGRLRATGADGEPLLDTALAAYQAPPSHRLRLRPIPPDGWPSEDYFEFSSWRLLRVDEPQAPIIVGRAVPYTDVVVPDGVYYATVTFRNYHPQRGDAAETILVDPEVVVDGEDTELVIDGRTAQPVEVDTPRPSETQYVTTATKRDTTFGGDYTLTAYVDWEAERRTLQLTPTEPVTVGEVHFGVTVAAPQAALDLRTADPAGPELYATWGSSLFQQPRLSGEHAVELVDVGAGTAEEIDRVDVAGKLALVKLDFRGNAVRRIINDDRWELWQIQQRLADAGALAAVTYLQQSASFWCGPVSVVPQCQGFPQDPTPLPVISLGSAGGAALQELAAGGPVAMELTSRDTHAEYAYRLHDVRGVIPDPPVYQVSDDELAEVTNRFRAAEPSDLRHRIHPLSRHGPSTGGFGATLQMPPGPGEFTQYLGPVSDDVMWLHLLEGSLVSDRHLLPTDGQGRLAAWLPRIHDEAGPETLHWGESATVAGLRMPPEIIDSGLSERFPLYDGCVMCRDDRSFNNGAMLSFGDGTRYGNSLYFDTAFAPHLFDVHLYRNGEEVPPTIPGVNWDLSGYPEPAEYRLSHRVRPGYLPNQTAIATDWTFTSEEPDSDETLPRFECFEHTLNIPPDERRCRVERMLFLGYEVDPMLQLDETGAAPGGTAITVSVFRQVGAPEPDVAGFEMEVSYDGGDTWSAVPAQAMGDREYQVLLRHPAQAETVSLRTQVWDTDGNRTEQTLTDYYRLADRCDTTIDGTHRGPLRVHGEVVCLAEGARVIGPVTVGANAGLVAAGTRITGRVTAEDAATVQLRDSRIIGPISVSGTTGGLTLDGNTIRGAVRLHDNQPAAGPPVLAGNELRGSLVCSGNAPDPTSVELGNAVTGRSAGQCAGLTN